ncbi:serotransferrin-like [Hemitrygon akajei]|uniref:serotransferrin-like n=1 Tax=Hemitrygon akajei TaxID=2704970 RepID=UPI003BF96946
MMYLHSVILAAITALSFAADTNITWCTISTAELSKCNDLKAAMSDHYFNFRCIKEDSAAACLTAIKTGKADAVTVDGGDIYEGGLLPEPRLKPIAAEKTEGESCYYAVAVVKQGSNFQFHDLKGRKSCHTGLGKSTGWYIPIGTILKYNLTSWNGVDPIEEVVGNFFSSSCVPGAKATFPKLCALCKGTAENHCKRSHEEPYYDYSGAFLCLKEGAGDVAFVKHTTVPYAERDHYELLCVNGTRKPIGAYNECHWAKVPAHAVVARGGAAEEAKNEAIWRFLSRAQDLYGKMNNSTFSLFSSTKYGHKDLLFKDSTKSLIHLPHGMDHLLYLGSEYADVIRILKSNDSSFLNPEKIRWCTIGDLEFQKCSSWEAVSCVKGKSTEDCIRKIKFRDADAVNLDGGEVYIGGKCGLVPVMAEYYDKTNPDSCKPSSVVTRQSSYYAVAVVKDPSLTWEELKGKKSCHTAVGRTAGWNVPMGTLVEEGKIDACEIYNSTFFKESCAPGADASLHPNLCSLCIGSETSTDKCEANTNERYLGYSGAFRCLVEKGDVAFIKHTTVSENTDGNGMLDWNRNLTSDNYYLLCKNGTTTSVDQFLNCHLAEAPAHAVMTRPDKRDELLKLLKGEQLKHGREGTMQDTFQMFSSASFSGKDLLFKDSTQCLIEVQSDYRRFLTENYIKILEAIHACEPPGAASVSPIMRLRWCTTSDLEQSKCNNWTSVDCVQATSKEDCVWKIKMEEADAAILHSSVLMAAGKCGLVPVMTEYYNKENLEPCHDPTALTEPYVYIVAVVKDKTLTWDSLRGKKSCHTAMHRTGWMIPMGLLIAQGKIENCTIYNSTYFSESCVPGGDPESKLCSLCAGRASSTDPGRDKCAFSPNEQYFGYKGAFRCLTEKGDVTFIKDTTVFENTDGNLQEDWAKGLKPRDYRLLCLNGSQAAVTDYKTCHLAQVPAQTVVSRRDMKDQVLSFLKEEQRKYGRNGTEKERFSMFSTNKLNPWGILFASSTQCLVEVMATSCRELLGEGYVTAMEGLHRCAPADGPAAPCFHL